MNAGEVLTSFYESLNSLGLKIVFTILDFCSSSSSSYSSSSAVSTTDNIVDDDNSASAAATIDNIVDDDNSSYASATEIFDVFISFRGTDTRDSFASHLYDALCVEKITTFIDDRLEKGGEIPSELLKTIENSRISIVIFSENYASSRWCLEELEHILKCKKTIVPVFYRVDPTDVRRQKGSYATALSKLQQYYGIDKVLAWKSALSKAVDRSGFHSYQIRPEAKLVKEIVQDVLNKLKASWPSDLNLKGFFGLELRVKQIESLLCIDLKDVRTIGLWGMPGIGKTTLAKFVFYHLKSKFEASCFMENFREESKKGPSYIQNELCSKLLSEKNLDTIAPFLEPSIANRLSQKKVLIVFDDVSNPRELEFLYGMIQFGPGSRIIVTTRDHHVLRSIKANIIYTVQELSEHDALKLFQFRAFRTISLATEDEELSKRVMKYANGNTLALTVLGSHLYDRNKFFWESTLNKLQEIPNKEIQKVLQISYDELEDNVKNIFLDLSCFFKSEKVHISKHIVDGCGFFWDEGLEILKQKSLVMVDRNEKVWMHDLIQQMGREVVRQESPTSPERRTRLWKANEIYQVLQNDIGTGEIEGICFNLSELDHRLPLDLKHTTLSKMYKLRILKIYKSNEQDKMCEVYIPPNFQPLPDTLRYLHWEEFPFKSLPLRFRDNLIALHLPNSQIEDLSDESKNIQQISENMGCSYLPDNGGEKVMKSLLYLSLSGCSSLNKLSHLPRNIIELDLRRTSIVTVPESIEYVSNLKLFNLRDCKRLENLPRNICKLKRLEDLHLEGCTNLKSFPEIFETMEHLEHLVLHGTAIEELPWQIEYLTGLRFLVLTKCKNLVSLPTSINRLGNLSQLDLEGCESLKTLPELASSIEQLFIDSFILLPSFGYSQLSNGPKLDEISWKNQMDYTLHSNDGSLKTLPKLLSSSSSLGQLVHDNNILFSSLGDLQLSNCPMLKENPRKNQINFALHVNDEWTSMGYETIGSSGLIVSYPSNQVPEWMEGEVEGNSLRINSGCSFSNLLGLVVCAHVAVNHRSDRHPFGLLTWKKNFRASNGFFITFQDAHCIALNSDHVNICSSTNVGWLRAYDFCEIEVDFSIKSIDEYWKVHESEISEFYQVKRCGFKCIYVEDLEKGKSFTEFS